MPFVVDASVTLTWHFDDERTAATDRLLERTIEESIVVPPHWLFEVLNGALMGERRGRATPDQTVHLRARLKKIEVEMDTGGEEEGFERVLPLARAHRLTIYDALYLELAERRGLPLATLDGPLTKAARSIGLTVLGADV